MKYIFILFFLVSNAFAKEVCHEHVDTVVKPSVKKVKSIEPKDIQEIIIIDSNGTKHYLSTKDYSVVPNIASNFDTETIHYKTLSCKKVVRDYTKHLVGVRTVVTETADPNYGVGVRYDRNVYRNLYLGITTDTTGSYGFGISVGF